MKLSTGLVNRTAAHRHMSNKKVSPPLTVCSCTRDNNAV